MPQVRHEPRDPRTCRKRRKEKLEDCDDCQARNGDPQRMVVKQRHTGQHDAERMKSTGMGPIEGGSGSEPVAAEAAVATSAKVAPTNVDFDQSRPRRDLSAAITEGMNILGCLEGGWSTRSEATEKATSRHAAARF